MNVRDECLLYEVTFSKMPLQTFVGQLFDRYTHDQREMWETDYGGRAIASWISPLRANLLLNKFIGPLPRLVKQSVIVWMWAWQGFDQPRGLGSGQDIAPYRPDWYNDLRKDLEEGQQTLEFFNKFLSIGIKPNTGERYLKFKTATKEVKS